MESQVLKIGDRARNQTSFYSPNISRIELESSIVLSQEMMQESLYGGEVAPAAWLRGVAPDIKEVEIGQKSQQKR